MCIMHRVLASDCGHPIDEAPEICKAAQEQGLIDGCEEPEKVEVIIVRQEPGLCQECYMRTQDRQDAEEDQLVQELSLETAEHEEQAARAREEEDAEMQRILELSHEDVGGVQETDNDEELQRILEESRQEFNAKLDAVDQTAQDEEAELARILEQSQQEFEQQTVQAQDEDDQLAQALAVSAQEFETRPRDDDEDQIAAAIKASAQEELALKQKENAEIQELIQRSMGDGSGPSQAPSDIVPPPHHSPYSEFDDLEPHGKGKGRRQEPDKQQQDYEAKLAENRAIRAEQDRAYQASLAADKEKAAQRNLAELVQERARSVVTGKEVANFYERNGTSTTFDEEDKELDPAQIAARRAAWLDRLEMDAKH